MVSASWPGDQLRIHTVAKLAREQINTGNSFLSTPPRKSDVLVPLAAHSHGPASYPVCCCLTRAPFVSPTWSYSCSPADHSHSVSYWHLLLFLLSLLSRAQMRVACSFLCVRCLLLLLPVASSSRSSQLTSSLLEETFPDHSTQGQPQALATSPCF